jgi:hypothetical protein
VASVTLLSSSVTTVIAIHVQPSFFNETMCDAEASDTLPTGVTLDDVDVANEVMLGCAQSHANITLCPSLNVAIMINSVGASMVYCIIEEPVSENLTALCAPIVAPWRETLATCDSNLTLAYTELEYTIEARDAALANASAGWSRPTVVCPDSSYDFTSSSSLSVFRSIFSVASFFHVVIMVVFMYGMVAAIYTCCLLKKNWRRVCCCCFRKRDNAGANVNVAIDEAQIARIVLQVQNENNRAHPIPNRIRV